SGPATFLVDRDPMAGGIECPIKLPPSMASKDYCQYAGYYHTDQTIPAEYFRPDVERPATQPAVGLDLTYLFHDTIENEDHVTMGKGRRLRDEGDDPPINKEAKATARLAYVEELPWLVAALAKYPR